MNAPAVDVVEVAAEDAPITMGSLFGSPARRILPLGTGTMVVKTVGSKDVEREIRVHAGVAEDLQVTEVTASDVAFKAYK
jgi:hypothetical protein